MPGAGAGAGARAVRRGGSFGGRLFESDVADAARAWPRQPDQHRAPTAGVSVSTVSKVLNGRTDVAPETRERLGRILRRHGYQVAPRSGIGVVDLLIGHLGRPVGGRADPRRGHGGGRDRDSVIVSPSAPPRSSPRWLKIAAARGTLGALSVLYLPDLATLRRLADARLPLVVIDPPTEPGGDIRSVGTTNWQGGLSATRHLIELGHRRIAAIGGPDHLWSCRRPARRLPQRPAPGGPAGRRGPGRPRRARRPDGLRQAHRLLGLAEPPTAIVAANDAQAFGVLQALAERGLRAPTTSA